MFSDYHRRKGGASELGARVPGERGPFGVFPHPGGTGPAERERPVLDRWLADAGEEHPVAGWSRGAEPAAFGAALDAMEDVLGVLDRVAGDDPRWRAKRSEFAGLRSPGQLLQMRGEFVVARALAEAVVPYGLGDLQVSNPDFLLADGAGGGGGPVAGVEVTAVSPTGIAELCELVESEGGLGDVRVELEFTAYPSRLQDGAAGQILDAVRVQAAVLAGGGQAGDAVVTVEDMKNAVPVTVTVRVRPGGGPLVWQVTGGELEGPMASAEYAVFQAGRGKEKAKQGRSLDGAPVILAVDISRYGAAWMRPARVWAGRLAVSEDFGAGYPFAAVGVFRQSLTTSAVLDAAVGIPSHIAPDARRTVLGLCERLGWSVAPAD
ncbi:hypothetical protein [Streptomyces sp. NPDC002215]|uniref:hypothetical protein n=1 Tax=Streptomyces sp. NPDC002215 TaxID=3154412 RepID=UPI00332853FA